MLEVLTNSSSKKHKDIPSALQQQFKAEVGDDALTEAETRMLQQKYGIIAPQFTPGESSRFSIKRAA
jgi:hypothetical protein